MSQTIQFDEIGMSVSFSEALQELNLKGVQTESLGYLHVRHTLKHGTYDSVFRPNFMKYVKYDESNTYDLNKLKLTSLSEENFDQIENFVEYEQYLKRSYFAHVQREVN
jgi:N-acetyltransferase B complex (NatB) non catalytic subunit